jgi:hypothetical protein
MDQVRGVRGVERTRDLRDDVDGTLGRERPGREHGGQILALDEAHIEVEASVDLAVVMDRDDVRLAEPDGQLTLPAEPRTEPGGRRRTRGGAA